MANTTRGVGDVDRPPALAPHSRAHRFVASSDTNWASAVGVRARPHLRRTRWKKPILS